MDLRISVTADAGLPSVGISGSRMELCFGMGRKVSFEGAFGDISFRFLLEEGEQPEAVPATVEEAITGGTGEAQGEEPEQSVSLFQQLSALRRQIASEEGHPPFLIFHDNTLSEMCRVLPRDMKELKAIQGIGEAKLVKYGQRFLDAINN